MPLVNARRRLVVRCGFTLVELLVVIGIIALLIAILLPALSRARESANMLKCQATLRSMAQAAHLHAAEHQGYMPLAGALYPTDRSAAGIGDAQKRKYTYFFDEANYDAKGNTIDSPAPLSAALGRCMNLTVDLSDRKKLQACLLQETLYRAFTCPSDTNPTTPASTIIFNGSYRTPDEVMSYLFNGAVLAGGRFIEPNLVPPGKLSKIRRPAEVFLFCDGKRGEEPGIAYEIACFGDYMLNGTLYDYLNQGGTGPGRANFDAVRHRQKMNVAFVDGHVETIELPRYGAGIEIQEKSKADFKRVGVSKGVYQ